MPTQHRRMEGAGATRYVVKRGRRICAADGSLLFDSNEVVPDGHPCIETHRRSLAQIERGEAKSIEERRAKGHARSKAAAAKAPAEPAEGGEEA